ncbi:exodeoxyribonuclease V subunit beta [Candidatus Palibaumannia cicadellinicola]|uniref:RecBCD enzyme subunit RecB n=1 Tax=Candidatus Palibaumannia cicadellinicola TaxID=186490 RepID=A0A2N4XWC4_9GAMM|nr:exodeoxyribonuclease V subunit beta [Candidatus Baumannia cicadellinicola]
MTLPLQHSCLIEASAGTGKTYTLVALYLRLLLGIGGESAYARPLSVKEILLVTFTDAITQELRSRIRDNIHRLRLSCFCGYSDDPLLANLLVQITNLPLAARQLLAAEQQIDEAAIFTIHSFCQRMLNYGSLESGVLFQNKFLENESHLLQQISADFWRRYCYPLPENVARIVQQQWKSPNDLLTELLPYLHSEALVICNIQYQKESIIDCHNRIIININSLKQQWCTFAPHLHIILDINNLNRLVYSKTKILSWLKKISLWANEPTIDYEIPIELEQFKTSVLKKNTLQGEPPHHLLFASIEQFYRNPFSLREFILMLALDEIRQALEQEKKLRDEIGFDDLLRRFDSALASKGGEALAQSVRSRYPVAMIDEFQDTDPQQYRIFNRLYGVSNSSVLLLIGDPKQAIYSFRGADIFIYMRARELVKHHYTLDTNWRSAPGMVNAVNQLFLCLPKPFIFRDIPFKPVAAAESNVNLRFLLHDQPQPAMRLWLQVSNAVRVSDYQHMMARQCAVTVSDWLKAASAGLAWLEDNKGKELLQASDIAILVRNRNEAALISDALTVLSIQSIYLSNFNSVFKTTEAREIMWLLQAVLEPEQDTKLRCALATSLLSCNADIIDTFNIDEHLRNKWRAEFFTYRDIWLQRGVWPMLHYIITRNSIAELLLACSGGERCLTNVLHLGELLQAASVQLNNEYALVRWLASQIRFPNDKDKNQQLWLESDRNLVQIVTVHKSKGLEFPLVLLPFASNFRQTKWSLFHDRQQYQAWFDLSAAPNSIKLAEEERLAEDLRLLYVAVTRSIYHCCIGIAPLFHGNRKKTGASDLHLSALGYLIQQGNYGNAQFLRDQLEKLLFRARGDIALCDIKHPQSLPLTLVPAQPKTVNVALSARYWPNPKFDIWRVTSYTGLRRHSTSLMVDLQPWLDVEVEEEASNNSNRQQNIEPPTPHTFPCGVFAGKFLHSLFETIDFTRQLDSNCLSTKLAKNSIDQRWLPVIQQWIKTIITTSLNGTTLSLNRLDRGSYFAELPFVLSVNTVVKAQDIDKLCKHYDRLSARCPPLDFPPVKGLLKGVIDLVFCWQKRYYLLDYKSNWLGEDNDAYTSLAVEQAMIAHRYELQYQLYTLALHRYMRHRLVDYDYQRDFGGIFYLFIRGFDMNCPDLSNNSIYTCRPDVAFINQLDQMFSC